MASMSGGSAPLRFERATPKALLVLFLAASGWTVHAWRDPGPASSRVLPEPSSRGKRVWQERSCSTCHQLYGLGGFLGPDLTNAMRRLDAAYVADLLRNGKGEMPALGLSGGEIDVLISFLESVDRSGTFPPRSRPLCGFNN